MLSLPSQLLQWGGSLKPRYNRGQLRRGARVDPQAEGRARRHTSTWSHSNAWTLDGTINLAFSLIGMLSPDANTLKKTRREIDATAAVALAAAAERMPHLL